MADGWGAQIDIISWNGPEVAAKYHTVLAWGLGDTAYDVQQLAKGLVHVESGRLQGSIAASAPGEDLMVSQHDEPVEQGRTQEECRAIAQTLDIQVGAFTPYAHREEIVRGHNALVPAFDAGLAELSSKLAAAAEEFGPAGGEFSLGSAG